MGTVVTLDLRDEPSPAVRSEAFEQAVSVLERIDADFSTWKRQSWTSRLVAGLVTRADCPASVRHVLDLADQAEELTSGYFCPSWHASGGPPDPTGLVKGWAAGEVSALLSRSGARDHLVNAAGDIVLSGRPDGTRNERGSNSGPDRGRGTCPALPSWQVGLSDPEHPGRLLGAVALPAGGRWAVATSGSAERGVHIINPRIGRPAGEVSSATVIVDEQDAPTSGVADLGAVADACATALVAAEREAPTLLRRLRRLGFLGVVVFRDGARHDPDGLLGTAVGQTGGKQD
jgi:thiamine biosynthesis lipoprotein